MKKLVYVFGLIALFMGTSLTAQETLSPYFKIADVNETIDVVSTQLQSAIETAGWEVIGEYHPAAKDEMFVFCFTNDELKNLSLQFKDRGALASVLKVAMLRHGDTTTISLLNPEYMFLAYWGEQLNGQEKQLKDVSEKAIAIFSSFGNPEPFGGLVKTKDLPDYHYMMMMPYFNDPVELNEYASFEEGVDIIRKNLDAGKGLTVKVYEQVFEGEEIAVFGVGLLNAEEGEAHFLPIIGEDHIANLPYEIILQGKEATMLHGKYRIAIFWPELKMGQFMKISSTPGEIEDALNLITGDEADIN